MPTRTAALAFPAWVWTQIWKESRPVTVSPLRRPCVVAIDASDDVRNLYREMLGGEGYDVATLDCRDATRDALREIGPSVIVLDCFLGCDPAGWDLLQVLSLDAELQHVPVVICTTDIRMAHDAHRAALEDDIVVLPKPFDVQELLGVIATALAPETPATT
jgi:DNA-binding NtrC family response regulator